MPPPHRGLSGGSGRCRLPLCHMLCSLNANVQGISDLTWYGHHGSDNREQGHHRCSACSVPIRCHALGAHAGRHAKQGASAFVLGVSTECSERRLSEHHWRPNLAGASAAAALGNALLECTHNAHAGQGANRTASEIVLVSAQNAQTEEL